MTESNVVSIVVALVAILGFAFTIFRASSGQLNSLRKEIVALVDKVEAVESRARHDLANNVASQLAGISARVGSLEKETVRRDEIGHSQARIEAKIEKQGEAIARLGIVEERMAALSSQLSEVLKRLGDR